MRRLTLAAALVLAAAIAGPASAQGPVHQAGGALNMEVVGHHDLGGRGFNADVWVHEEHAYVGSWGFSDWNTGGEERFCPNDGVAVIDSSDPANPAAGLHAGIAGGNLGGGRGGVHRPVRAAGRPRHRRRGLQVCGGSRYDATIFRGLQLFDVTDPTDPFELGKLSTGCCARGLHELEVQHRPDLSKTFVYASVPASEYLDPLSPSGRRDQAGRGDFRLIDVTNPPAPVEVSDWGVHRNLGGPPAAGQGCDPDPEFGHSAEPSADGKLVFVAYWDSGFIALDVSNPAMPVFKGRTVYPPNADGDGHSSNFDEGRELLFTADEDFCKTSGSGTRRASGTCACRTTRAWTHRASLAEQIGSYRTPNSSGSKDVGAGDYTIHNPLIVGTDLYISWYTDGIRVVDANDPRNPRRSPSSSRHRRRTRFSPRSAARSRTRPRSGAWRTTTDGPRLRERHELRALDPGANRLIRADRPRSLR